MTVPRLATKGPRGRVYPWPPPPDDPQMFLPSITRILGVMDKPALPRWSANMVAEEAVRLQQTGALSALIESGEHGPAEAIKMLKGAPWSQRDRAGVRGDSLHGALEAHLRGDEVPVLEGDVLKAWEHLKRTLDVIDLQAVHIESTVAGDCGGAASPTEDLGYMGTADGIADITIPAKGGTRTVRVAFDLKSSAHGRVFPEAAMQVAAARFSTHLITDAGDVIPTPHTEGGVILTAHPGGADVVPVDTAEDTAFAAFCSCRRIYELTDPAVRYVRPAINLEALSDVQ